MTSNRAIVGMSGGVDSSVAALLLREQGYEVHGVFMKNWEDAFEPGYCTAADDLEDARDVCETLAIPMHTVNFSRHYRERVFQHFLDEYDRGRTPNPDILCNKEIKFKAFMDYTRHLGGDFMATGHYARLSERGERLRLLKGVDPHKDQSYFLHSLSQQQLAGAAFPLGGLSKQRVRRIAGQAGLITCDKQDSTGICFIGERDFRRFLQRFLPSRPGPMLTPEGKPLGEHAGLMFYTLGQRQGLGIGGRRGDNGKPWYVVDKDLERNALIVAQGADHPLLYHRSLSASAIHWIAGEPPRLPLSCHAKIRYRQPDQACTVQTLTAGNGRVSFERPQRAITPGQSVVFYHGDECLGGGIIDKVFD